MLTQEELKKYVTYDPETGLFRATGVKYSNKKEGELVGVKHKTKGYVYLTIKGKTYRAQRLAFLYMLGEFPKYQVDHINRIKDDNRWVNLRDVDASTNCQNRPLFTTNTSGFKGVCWNKNVKKWQVNCRVQGKTIYGGLYQNKEEAAEVAELIYDMCVDL